MKPRVFRAPGRVNLIGEHTDYNDGFVMPAAIHFSTTVKATPRDDRQVVLRSDAFPETIEFELDDKHAAPRRKWSDYVQGVAIYLAAAGYRVNGAGLQVSSDLPIGSGLSSSAALEVSAGLALAKLSGQEVPPLELALICQKAENLFVGIRSGIMDQYASTHGRKDHAMLIDCRALTHRLLPLPPQIRLVICNTMVKHELNASEYNKRRADCEAAARAMGVEWLRDATPDLLARTKLEPRIRMRAEHVIFENLRTQSGAEALAGHDLDAFGKLMYESHASLRDLYEVSCKELDLMVEIARRQAGIYGARMTGGGFGGCTINLVKEEAVKEFTLAITEGYREGTGITPEIYVCQAVDGAVETTA